MKKLSILSFAALFFFSCTSRQTLSGLDPKAFETDSTSLYVLKSKSGMEACITNYGARLVSLMVPASDGSFKDVVLGPRDIATYLDNVTSHGATMGPYVGRIAGGRFSLDGKEYRLECNDKGNTLHGGPRTWRCSCYELVESSAEKVHFRLFSPDGQYGFPGDVSFDVTYTLTDDSLDILYEAETTAPTVLNVTNHSFFNLSGDAQKTILDHELYIASDFYAPTDRGQIPTGELCGVEGTPFDFRVPKAIGRDLNANDIQLDICGGYDHSFLLNSTPDKPAAVLYCPSSGIRMTVYTDQPCLQFFSANNSNPSFLGKDGLPFLEKGGVCLETQHFPDSPNHPEFPSTELAPGEKFVSRTSFVFGK